MSSTKTRNAIEAGYNFHTDPRESMVSFGLVAKVAGWDAIEFTDDTAGAGVATIISHGDIRITIVETDGGIYTTVHDNGELVGDSGNPAEAVWWILDNSPGAVYPLPK